MVKEQTLKVLGAPVELEFNCEAAIKNRPWYKIIGVMIYGPKPLDYTDLFWDDGRMVEMRELSTYIDRYGPLSHEFYATKKVDWLDFTPFNEHFGPLVRSTFTDYLNSRSAGSGLDDPALEA